MFHYIDDFATLGTPGSAECARNNTIMHEASQELGLPPEPEKDEGPATTIVFTGMEIDTVSMVIRLPRDKLQHYEV